MGISPVGFMSESEQEVSNWAETVTNITHYHPDALKSAKAVALSIYWARNNVCAEEIGYRIKDGFAYDTSMTPDQIRPGYVRTYVASRSVPQAISCALHSDGFEDAIRNAVLIDGDSDTIAAIAGGIAEVLYGIPDDHASQAWRYLPPWVSLLQLK